jgi:carbamoyl-phosphate synthase large subunit
LVTLYLRSSFFLIRVFPGQLPQNIALRLKESGVNVLGTDPEQIDRAEDRHKFSAILDSVGVDQPDWAEVATLEEAKTFANRVG